MEGSETYFAGIEPVEIGNLEEIKETRSVIPATRRVRMKIRKAEILVNPETTYRSLNLQLQLSQGIGSDGKYKNKVVFSRICYYADPNVYVKDFFKNRQHLVPLKQLSKATGIDLSKVDGHTPELLEQAPEVLADITIRKRSYQDPATGEVIETMDNDARNFTALPLTDQV